MKIDTEHLHHWMQAIRQSNNPMRTMDAFWSGQIKSKEWLIDTLEALVDNEKELTIDIHGGWVGTLASLLFQSKLNIKHIRSLDIDPHVEHIATEMNRLEYNQGRFVAETHDMTNIFSTADIVINTSCEHLTQEQYDTWLDKQSPAAMLILQGNNYAIDEHVRISKDITEFEQQCKVNRKFVGTKRLPIYDRYMIIGNKNVQTA